jgi:hypothetical protein
MKSAFNWPIDKGSFPSWNTFANEAFRVHSIGQYMKVVFPSWTILANEAFGVHSIGRQMKVVLSS